MKTLKKLLLLLVAAATLHSCKNISGDDIKWIVPDSGLEYDATESYSPGNQTSWVVSFTKQGNDVLQVDGDDSSVISISETGVFTYSNPDARQNLYERSCFSVLPVKGTKIKQGLTWEVVWPDDNFLQSHTNAIVVQEKVKYYVEQIDDNEIVIKTESAARIVDNAGFDSLLIAAQVPLDSVDSGTHDFLPYSEGRVIFDKVNGCVKTAEGKRAPFNYFLAARDSVSNIPLRLNYSINKK